MRLPARYYKEGTNELIPYCLQIFFQSIGVSDDRRGRFEEIENIILSGSQWGYLDMYAFYVLTERAPDLEYWILKKSTYTTCFSYWDKFINPKAWPEMEKMWKKEIKKSPFVRDLIKEFQKTYYKAIVITIEPERRMEI